MKEWDIFAVDLKSQKYGIPKKIRETIYCTVLLHNVTYHTSNCFLAWMSVFVWYAIKIDIRPCPVSIFGDYGAIKENIYGMLRKQAGKWQHQTSRQSLHSWEFCTRLWSCFSDSLKIVFFQMQQVFIIESQSELFKLFLQLGNNAKLLILCFLTSWAAAVTSVQGNAFSRKKDAVSKFQYVVLFFVKLFLF